MITKHYTLQDEEDCELLGQQLASHCHAPFILFLQGDLGAGKTTLARAMLRAYGVTDNIKSPTFTLLEPYALNKMDIYHFDLYRLNDSTELETIGIRDYFHDNAICLFEWPERGKDVLPDPDLLIQLTILQNTQRSCDLTAKSPIGKAVLQKMNETL